MELAKRREGLPLISAFAQLGTVLLFAVLPAVILPVVAYAAGGDFLWDFRKEFLPAGRAILDGNSPFPTASQLTSHANYVYPPLAALLLAPFTWLPQTLAEGLFIALILAAPAVSLWLLGVRDWRCYGIVYLWPPLIGDVPGRRALDAPDARGRSGLALAPLRAGLRWRDRRRRRRKAFPVAVARALRDGVALARGDRLDRRGLHRGAGLLGADRLRRPGRLPAAAAEPLARRDSAQLQPDGIRAGDRPADEPRLGRRPRCRPAALIAAARLVRRPDGELAALACAVGACFALSPVVWLHYLILLIVPIAVARDRLGPVWFVPLLFWLSPSVASAGNAWAIALAIGVTALTLVLVAAPGRVLRTTR